MIVRLEAKPGRRDERRKLLRSISAACGPSAQGYLGSTAYEALDSTDTLVEIADWESAQSQADAVQRASATGVYASVVELVAAPFQVLRVG